MKFQPILEKLVLETGVYSPAELLLAINQLSYDDYLAWRRGELGDLDAVLIDGLAETRTLLELARAYSETLGLTAGRVVYEGWGKHAGRRLAASSEQTLDELLHTHYGRESQEGQLDIFLDSAEVVATNALVEALRARSPDNARRALARLAKVAPEHRYRASAAALIQALELPVPQDHAEALERCDTLTEAWLPAASTLFAGSASDFLRPLWRDIGSALDAARFDPQRPDRHASWAYRSGLDWDNVKRSVRAVQGYARVPVLLGLLAQAEWRLHDRLSAVRRWFEICRVAPQHFKELIESPDFPDLPLRRAWRSADEQDPEPEILVEWFPAWMLLQEPGLARALAPSGDPDGPGRAFDLAMALLTTNAQDVGVRGELKAIHPALFASFMADARLTGEGSPPRAASAPLWPES